MLKCLLENLWVGSCCVCLQRAEWHLAEGRRCPSNLGSCYSAIGEQFIVLIRGCGGETSQVSATAALERADEEEEETEQSASTQGWNLDERAFGQLTSHRGLVGR